MPLLAKETYHYPDDLFGASSEPDSDLPSLPSDAPWWALYTFSRNEKTLMRKLKAQGQHFYCPVVRRPHRVNGGAPRDAYVPLFSNYVFLQGDEYARYQAVCTGHVSRYLPIVDVDRFVRQMRSIHRLIDAGVPVDLESRLVVGRWVRIKSGPLKNLQGQIRQVRRQMQFIVNVDFLGQGASTLVEGWDLEPLL